LTVTIEPPVDLCGDFHGSKSRGSFSASLSPAFRIGMTAARNEVVGPGLQITGAPRFGLRRSDDQYPVLAPSFIVRGAGCHVWDAEGREYIEYDGQPGSWPWSRLSRLLLLILGVVLAFAACSAKAAFPLAVAPGGRFLVDAAGEPFLIQGDAAWSLIAQLRREDFDLYFADRRKRGFNTILVSLIEHRFASEAPSNAYGQRPFLTPGDFTSPNENYFAHADWVLQRAAEGGFLVLLAPCYAGINGGEEGWYREMVAAGPEKLRRYGEYLGRRYRDFKNIVWVNAGDYDPPDKSLVRAIAEGIRAEDPHALQTAQGSPESSTLDYWGPEPWLQLNAVYTYAPLYLEMQRQRARPDRMPYFLIESTYENEHGATSQRLRMQAYQALLFGAAGQVFGNNPIWHFDGPGLYSTPVSWVEGLDSEGARSMTHLGSLMGAFAWWKMVPDVGGSLLVEGLGPRQERAVAALAEDGSFALVYLPSRRDVVIDLGRLAGPRVAARWYDPADGRFADAAGSPLIASGRHRFRPELESNSAGEDDWVLVLESRP
jgi:hypothetical protein